MAGTGDFYDDLETRDPEAREKALLSALPDQVAHARANAPFYSDALKDVDAKSITSREALAALPVTRKSEVIELQKSKPPFGGLAAIDAGDAAAVFTSPGPIYELMSGTKDYFGLGRSVFACGFRKGELIHNSLAYHMTPGGWMFHSGAQAVGCAVFPAGVGNTEQQVEALAHLKPAGYGGTPDFLQVLLGKADEMKLDVSSVKKAMVGGGPLFPAMREAYNARGISVLQNYATAELGLIAYESPALEGMILDERVIVEIVRPGTGDPVDEGEVGEVVVTTMVPELPLIRFATGDLSAVMTGQSPCGRTNTRIKGWMGRADQTTKVRGMFVRPEQIAAVAARHGEIAKARLTVDHAGGKDISTLQVEANGDLNAEAVAESFRAVCKVGATIERAEPGSLPNDGKVIDDIRKFD